MRIRVTRHTVALNRVVISGEVLDESVGLDRRDAETLVRLGKAVEIPVAVASVTPDKAADPGPGQAGDSPRPPAVLTTESGAALVRGKKQKKQKPPPTAATE